MPESKSLIKAPVVSLERDLQPMMDCSETTVSETAEELRSINLPIPGDQQRTADKKNDVSVAGMRQGAGCTASSIAKSDMFLVRLH
eukprot:748838-Hanusia_phi.AAC.11